MAEIIFDTLAYAKGMKEAGFTDKQAEFQAEQMARLIENQLVTKRDLKELEHRIVTRLGSMLGGMIVVSTGILAVLMKVL
jgi:hypothetical protein